MNRVKLQGYFLLLFVIQFRNLLFLEQFSFLVSVRNSSIIHFPSYFMIHSVFQIPVSSIQLNPVSGDYNGTVAEVQRTQNDSSLSKFFNFCQKLVLFAGIVSSFYYAYQVSSCTIYQKIVLCEFYVFSSNSRNGLEVKMQKESQKKL